MRRVRSRLTFANVCSFLALVIAIGTGGAYAANTVFSTDIVDGEVKAADIGTAAVQTGEIGNNQIRSEDVRDDTLSGGGLIDNDIRNASLTGSDVAQESLSGGDVADGTIESADVSNENLTGADIANQSGVDTCTHGTVRYGELCVGVANLHKSWIGAVILCSNLELRLPSLGEATSLAHNHDLPNVEDNEDFWTEEMLGSGPVPQAWIVNDVGGFTFDDYSASYETVCVTTPTN
jgi:hypothetical protein